MSFLEPIQPMGLIHPDEVFDIEKEVQRLLKGNELISPITIEPVTWFDDIEEKE